MKTTFLWVGLCVGVLSVSSTAVFGQVEMSAPVLRKEEGRLLVSTHFKGFEQGKDYRLGVGAVGQTPDAKLTFRASDKSLDIPSTDFTQGFTSDWWNVDQIEANGFRFKGDKVLDVEPILEVEITVERADKLKRIFFFVARDYGGGAWYLEDGVEINQSHW